MNDTLPGRTPLPLWRRTLLVISAGITLLVLLGGSVLMFQACTDPARGSEEIGLAFFYLWPVMFLLFICGSIVLAIGTARASGLGAAVLAWLLVCALAVLGLVFTLAILIQLGVLQTIAVASALILVDAAVIYAGWRLIRSRRRTL